MFAQSINNNNMDLTEYRREWRAKNRDKVLANKRKAYLKASAGFKVYRHVSKNGDIYIGQGNGKRPYMFSNRKDHHKEVFDKETTTIEILGEFKTKNEARELEALIIQAYGLENLINKNL